MATQAAETKNMRLIAHVDLKGHNNIGEGVDLHQTANGRRILYMAHESAPKDFTSVDVTDLANPKVVTQTDLDHGHLRSKDTLNKAHRGLNCGCPMDKGRNGPSLTGLISFTPQHFAPFSGHLGACQGVDGQ